MKAVKHKIVFLGDVCVGKTSLINRFIYDSFDNNYNSTVGIDFLCKTVSTENKTYRLQLWDTAGQERFRSLLPNYIRNSSVAVIVFDVTQAESFSQLEKWVNEVKTERSNCMSILVVGNKIDKQDERQVTREEAACMAEELGSLYLETSAKTRENIEELIHTVVGSLPEEVSIPKGMNLGTQKIDQHKSKCQC